NPAPGYRRPRREGRGQGPAGTWAPGAWARNIPRPPGGTFRRQPWLDFFLQLDPRLRDPIPEDRHLVWAVHVRVAQDVGRPGRLVKVLPIHDRQVPERRHVVLFRDPVLSGGRADAVRHPAKLRLRGVLE